MELFFDWQIFWSAIWMGVVMVGLGYLIYFFGFKYNVERSD